MRKGFTLIELLVVIAILGVLVSVVAVSLGGKSGIAKRNLSVVAVERLKGEVGLFKVATNRYPEDLEELVRRGQVEALPRDGWDRAFIYRRPGERGAPFDIVSYGADGAPGGTGADEDVWSHPPCPPK